MEGASLECLTNRRLLDVLTAGDCSFHHSLTVQGSGENPTPNRRRGLASAYMWTDSKWVGDEDKKQHFPLVRGRDYAGCV